MSANKYFVFYLCRWILRIRPNIYKTSFGLTLASRALMALEYMPERSTFLKWLILWKCPQFWLCSDHIPHIAATKRPVESLLHCDLNETGHSCKQAGHLLPFFMYFSQYEHLHWVCLIEVYSDYINPIHNINLADNGNMTKCPTIFLYSHMCFSRVPTILCSQVPWSEHNGRVKIC